MAYDQVALVAFQPDGLRAAFLHARMIDNLAQSVDEIVSGCSSHVDFEGNILRLPERIRALPRVAPEAYCIYYDLLQAVDRDDVEGSIRLIRELDARLEAPLPSFYSRWGALPGPTAERYLAYVNVDPTSPVNFKAPSSTEFDEVCRNADGAFAVLDRIAPEIAAEIRSLLTQIVFVSPATNRAFGGATSFLCFGATFLEAREHCALLAMIDGLTHESAHAYLFALSLGDPFVENSEDELFRSPLRSDPRPLDGIFHATYVSARLHYAYNRVIGGGHLSENEKDEAQNAQSASKGAFWDGLATLNEHASFTSLGGLVMRAAEEYMIGHVGAARRWTQA